MKKRSYTTLLKEKERLKKDLELRKVNLETFIGQLSTFCYCFSYYAQYKFLNTHSYESLCGINVDLNLLSSFREKSEFELYMKVCKSIILSKTKHG